MGVYRLNSPTQFTVNSTRPQPTVTSGTFLAAGGYHIITFTGNGSFELPFGATADVLVVAGGGGGAGATRSGGAGAGGLVTSTGITLVPSTVYPVTVGAGGTKGPYNNGNGDARGTNGSNSTALGQTALGGGRAGCADGTSFPGSQGGSGGGGWHSQSIVLGTAGQGNASGQPSTTGPYGSGGGGAGSVGGDALGPSGPVGGAGLANSLSGASTVYAGGGSSTTYNGAAAYLGGSGGGGTGSNNGTATSANNGVDGLGGGGGADGNGGSGIVIVRYTA